MHIALFQPEIPPNTGNIGRLCYCTHSHLHIIGQPAFSLDEAAVKRAGLDYWPQLKLQRHADWISFRRSISSSSSARILLFTRFAQYVYSEIQFKASDILVFGSESKGLPQNILEEIRAESPCQLLRIPVAGECRSLNLSNAVAIVLYEALRQQNFPMLSQKYQ